MSESNGGITRDDVNALLTASHVTFHHYQGKSFIRAHIDRHPTDDKPVIYSAREQRLFPVVTGHDRYREIAAHARASGYHGTGCGTGWTLSTAPNLAAFHSINSSQYSATWMTIARTIRAGDVLTLEWTADNNNEIIREAGLHTDELHLMIFRPYGKPSAGGTFLVTRTADRDNSARMIRRHG